MSDAANNTQIPANQANDMLCVKSADLFRDGRSVCIEHGGQRYLLRLTRENKLILTK